MNTVIISIVVGILAGAATSPLWDGLGGAITAGITAFIICFIILMRKYSKRLEAVVTGANQFVEEGQQEAMRLARRFETKPIGSQKVMQQQLEAKMESGIVKALESMEGVEALYKWHPLAERQINTVRAKWNYSIKRFAEVDKLLDKVFLFDPMTVAIKMARQYENSSPDLEKTFRKGVKRFKYDKALILYGLYSWILVKRKEYDAALTVLDEAKEKTDNETMLRNWQFVANNKVHLFSNAGLGEEWYQLHLEAPPKQKVSKGQMRNHPMMPKGKRRHF